MLELQIGPPMKIARSCVCPQRTPGLVGLEEPRRKMSTSPHRDLAPGRNKICLVSQGLVATADERTDLYSGPFHFLRSSLFEHHLVMALVVPGANTSTAILLGTGIQFLNNKSCYQHLFLTEDSLSSFSTNEDKDACWWSLRTQVHQLELEHKMNTGITQ